MARENRTPRLSGGRWLALRQLGAPPPTRRIPLFQILEDRGFEVCLVNARHVKNVPGRRTDVSDCQWLQFLHSVGLLRASYRPEQEVCAVRALLRHRESLVQMAATHVNHMQKALDQMNLQLHHVISDITGQTGLAIVDAILAGKRDPFELAKLRNERIKASEEVIAKSLVGDYRAEHLFTLRQSLAAYRSYQKLIDDCDREIRRSLEEFQSPRQPDASAGDNSKTQPKTPSTESVLRSELKRVFGIDLTKIPGIRVGIAQTLFGEIGPDFTKFRSASAFASWMGLCPDNDISGGKVLWVGTRKVNCRAATALRMAAQSLHHSKSAVSLPISCATKSVRRPNCAPRLKLWVSNSAPSHRPDEFLRSEAPACRDAIRERNSASYGGRGRLR